MIAALSGCIQKKSEPIYYGKDSCSHCKMVISDKRFGSELITAKGKVYKFDSLECMHSFEKEELEKVGSDYKEFITNTGDDGHLIPADNAIIYEDKKLRSPMGKGYLVFSSQEELKKTMHESAPISVMTWKELKKKLNE